MRVYKIWNLKPAPPLMPELYLIFLQFLAEESLPESHSEVKQDKYNEIMSKIESDPVWPEG